MSMKLGFVACALALALPLAGCGGSDSTTSGTSSTSSSSSTGSSSSGGGDAQTPPEGEAGVKTWLAAGHYQKWHCESAEHVARDPSPHGVNRICSNDKLAANDGKAPYEQGSAGVKELWDKQGGKIIGYAVYLKKAADSGAGANWYWYEFNPTIDANNPVADGMGDSGNAKTICVGCHGAAGSDAKHFGHDYVYTQVK